LQSTAQRHGLSEAHGEQSQPFPVALQVQAPVGSVQVQRCFDAAFMVTSPVEWLTSKSRAKDSTEHQETLERRG
jgi:hypothetical protein